jgi:hypothetical protein
MNDRHSCYKAGATFEVYRVLVPHQEALDRLFPALRYIDDSCRKDFNTKVVVWMVEELVCVDAELIHQYDRRTYRVSDVDTGNPFLSGHRAHRRLLTDMGKPKNVEVPHTIQSVQMNAGHGNVNVTMQTGTHPVQPGVGSLPPPIIPYTSLLANPSKFSTPHTPGLQDEASVTEENWSMNSTGITTQAQSQPIMSQTTLTGSSLSSMVQVRSTQTPLRDDVHQQRSLASQETVYYGSTGRVDNRKRYFEFEADRPDTGENFVVKVTPDDVSNTTSAPQGENVPAIGEEITINIDAVAGHQGIGGQFIPEDWSPKRLKIHHEGVGFQDPKQVDCRSSCTVIVPDYQGPVLARHPITGEEGLCRIAEHKETGAICFIWGPLEAMLNDVIFQNFPELQPYTKEFPKVPSTYQIIPKQKILMEATLVMPLKETETVYAVRTDHGYSMVSTDQPSTDRRSSSLNLPGGVTLERFTKIIEDAQAAYAPGSVAYNQTQRGRDGQNNN